MSTLGEDILALQKRLLEETGLEFVLSLDAFETKQDITAEQAMRAGEVLTQVLGESARIREYGYEGYIEVITPGVEVTIFCKELLGKVLGKANA